MLDLEAATAQGLAAYRVSFKGALSTARQWAPIMAAAQLDDPGRERMMRKLLRSIALVPLPERPNRTEPRARKRRPNSKRLPTEASPGQSLELVPFGTVPYFPQIAQG